MPKLLLFDLFVGSHVPSAERLDQRFRPLQPIEFGQRNVHRFALRLRFGEAHRILQLLFRNIDGRLHASESGANRMPKQG